jgi:hypothetical protein
VVPWRRRKQQSLKAKNKMNLTTLHEKAAHNHSLGLHVSPAIYARLEHKGLVERRRGEWALTDRGCDLAAGRLTVRRGKLVRSK